MAVTASPESVDNESECVSEIVLPRETGTHADLLAVLGLADLLSTITESLRVRIVNRGAAFAVVLPAPLDLATIGSQVPYAGYSYLQAKRAQSIPSKVVDSVDYESTRDQINVMRKQEEELRKALQGARQSHDQGKTEALSRQIDDLRKQWPMEQRRWRRYPPFLVLQGHDTANKVNEAICGMTPEEFGACVSRSLAALVRAQPTVAKWNVSTVQLFSPLVAKGYARLKPDSIGRGDKTKDAWADPFMEWLRYRGYFKGTVPAFHGSKGEHIRLAVPVPGDISLDAFIGVVDQLGAPRGGPPKIDVILTLDLARILIERSQEYHADGVVPLPGLTIAAKTPARVISGVAITNYQSLGQARAVSVLNETALPGWFPIQGKQDAEEWLAILAEHRAVITGLDDSHSDEFALVQRYRGFLERRTDSALESLLEFAGEYGTLVLRARSAGRRVRQFRTDHFRRVVGSMNDTYAEILRSEGFQAVAAAVRHATVTAQALSANDQDHLEIRYGLLPELRRARELPGNEPLLTSVGDFLGLYNAENARRLERHIRPYRRVTTAQLLGFTELVDRYGANVVGALLCAYGTCTDPRSAEQGEPPSAHDDPPSDPLS